MPAKPLRDRLLDIQEVVELQEFLQREPDIVEIVTARLQNTSEVARWSDSLLRATFVSQVAEQLKRRNSSNSAFEKHKIPTEITLEVINFTVQIFHPCGYACERDYFPQLQVIAGISSFFRDIIMHYPPLWAVADHRYPLQFVEMALRRSVGCPLAIDMASMGRTRRSLSSRRYAGTDFIDTVAPHMDRCRHIFMNIPTDGSGRQLIERPAPMVSTTYLNSGGAEFVTPIRLHDGQADQLRSLRVLGGGILWDTITFPRLETLFIGGTPTPSTNLPTLSIIIQWLKTSCDIIDLTLTSVPLNQDTSLQDTTPVHLPRLKRLWLDSDSPPDLVCKILPLIRVPALSNFSIRLSMWWQEEPVSVILRRTLEHLIPNMLAAFQRGGFVKVEVAEHYVSVCLFKPERAELVFRSKEPDVVIRWLAKNLGPIITSELVSLEISGGDTAFCSTDLILLLITSIPNLQHFTVHTTLAVSRLLEVLGSPQSNTGSYPFPNLVQLTLRTNAPPELILEMLQKRYGDGEANDAKLVQPLEYLLLSGLKDWPDDLRQRLEALLGEGELEEHWREPSYEDESSDGW